VGQLGAGEQTLGEPGLALERALDPFDFDQVDADARGIGRGGFHLMQMRSSRTGCEAEDSAVFMSSAPS
jgi:hypothetical protein